MVEEDSPVDHTNLGNLWDETARERWNGNVKDKYLGQEALGFMERPHEKIERMNGQYDNIKFETNADLRIVRESDGQVRGYNKSGSQVSLSYEVDGETKWVYNDTSFYNDREGSAVRCLEIDMANLIESGIDLGRGLIYVSEEPAGGAQAGVRIVNGATLPQTISGAFTLATDDPLYILGDFNVGADHIGALLAGDSINILSKAWKDSDNQSSADALRAASATETNALFVSGNVPSAEENYSGGAENYFRYNENWSGVTHRFRGSLLNLFESQTALGKWVYGGKVYTAPRRDWGWDDVFDRLSSPPGLDDVIEFETTKWEIVNL